MSEEMQMTKLKQGILLIAEGSMKKRFDNELSNFKWKREKLLTMPYCSFKNHIQNLDEQPQNKDKQLIKSLRQ